MFKEFDLDDSGFISPDSILSIMEATACLHSSTGLGPSDLLIEEPC